MQQTLYEGLPIENQLKYGGGKHGGPSLWKLLEEKFEHRVVKNIGKATPLQFSFLEQVNLNYLIWHLKDKEELA